MHTITDPTADPTDPRFYTPSRSPIPFSPPPTSGTEGLSSASPATPSPAPPASESGGNVELKRRKTIAERMAKLGGIKFGAPPPPPPPPVNRVQSPDPAQPAEDEDAEGSTAVPAQPAPEERRKRTSRHADSASLRSLQVWEACASECFLSNQAWAWA